MNTIGVLMKYSKKLLKIITYLFSSTCRKIVCDLYIKFKHLNRQWSPANLLAFVICPR